MRYSENKFHNVCFILQQFLKNVLAILQSVKKAQEEGKVKNLHNQDPFANTLVRFKMAVYLCSVVSGRHFSSN